MRVTFTEAELIDISTRALNLVNVTEELCSPKLKRGDFMQLAEYADRLAERVWADMEELCNFARAIRARCGNIEGECPRYSDPVQEAPCE